MNRIKQIQITLLKEKIEKLTGSSVTLSEATIKRSKNGDYDSLGIKYKTSKGALNGISISYGEWLPEQYIISVNLLDPMERHFQILGQVSYPTKEIMLKKMKPFIDWLLTEPDAKAINQRWKEMEKDSSLYYDNDDEIEPEEDKFDKLLIQRIKDLIKEKKIKHTAIKDFVRSFYEWKDMFEFDSEEYFYMNDEELVKNVLNMLNFQ